VGELEAKSVNFARAVDNTTKYYLFTHLDFSVAYNQDRVIEVNVTADPLQRVDLSTADAHKVSWAGAGCAPLRLGTLARRRSAAASRGPPSLLALSV